MWGHQTEYLEGLQEKLGVIPKALRERPTVHELGDELYGGFNALSSSRSYGMGGPLAVTIEAIYAYCQMFEISDLDDRVAFLHAVQRLDSVYLAEVAKRTDNPSGSAVVNQDIPLDNPEIKG